ncbi:hypothetical protein KC356_g6756 [Hortaea werneckii]|nr:hypothetical protein KC356_g6756 [Hortaea werneckii]
MDHLDDVDYNEHQKIMDGFGAQIGRLDRKLDTLRNQLITAEDVATVDKISEERAAIKKQKDALEKLQQEELADYHRTRLRVRTKNLPPAVQQGPPLNEIVLPNQQEPIDLTRDDIPSKVKREDSGSPVTSRPVSEKQRTQRGPQQPLEQDAQQVTQNPSRPETRRATTATSRNQIDLDFSEIADTHPTLVPSPDGFGAVELRCPICRRNAALQSKIRGGQPRFFGGAQGLQRHVRQAHGSQMFNCKTMPTATAIRECTWARVAQEVVDAIKSGDTKAYVVPAVTVDRRTGSLVWD